MFVWLHGFDLSEFEDENIQASIDKYSSSQSQSISFVNCAIVLGKPDNLIIHLMENLESFACACNTFYSTPFIAGISNELATVLFALSQPVLGADYHADLWNTINPKIQRTLQKLHPDLIYQWLERFSKVNNQSIQETIFESLDFFSSTEQLRQILDIMIRNGAHDIQFCIKIR